MGGEWFLSGVVEGWGVWLWAVWGGGSGLVSGGVLRLVRGRVSEEELAALTVVVSLLAARAANAGGGAADGGGAGAEVGVPLWSVGAYRSPLSWR
ncbi:acyl-CoA carboxylase epsilon subunit [Streptomyces sp. NPDC101209]|uniref:acyl-CoA carboxylase epsilon subunit n=1 Tax=Streptomyces sp. NPDC101209 TaxID=3366129 RepID=UPI0038282815